ETGPASRSIQIPDAQIRDAQFPRRIRGKKTVDPYGREKMMPILIEPDGIRSDRLLKKCGVPIVEGRNHRFDEIGDWTCRLSLRRKNIRPAPALLRLSRGCSDDQGKNGSIQKDRSFHETPFRRAAMHFIVLTWKSEGGKGAAASHLKIHPMLQQTAPEGELTIEDRWSFLVH